MTKTKETIKFCCTCLEPKPCSHERDVNEKGIFLKEIITHVQERQRKDDFQLIQKVIDNNLKDIEYTKNNLEEDEEYGEDDDQDLIHFHQLEGRRLALEELRKEVLGEGK